MLKLAFTNKDNFLRSKTNLGKIRKAIKILRTKEKKKKRKVTKLHTLGAIDVGIFIKYFFK